MNQLYGRRLLETELTDLRLKVEQQANVQTLPCMEDVSSKSIQCLRCGTLLNKKEVVVQNDSFSYYYCSECLSLGCVTSRDCFYYIPSTRVAPVMKVLQWEGRLSKGQKYISSSLLENIKIKKHTLIHAVTGAGKTEMLFESIAYGIEHGWRIGLASPRVDVCLELYPRLQCVFPKKKITLLYGKAEAPDSYTSFVICTTHQLLRYYHHFDLLIIDEIDAFPFKGDKKLLYGAQNSLSEEGVIVILTATPDYRLLQAEKKGMIEKLVLSKRYHGYPLPEPKFIWSWNWEKRIKKGKLPPQLYTILNNSLTKRRRLLIFMPTIYLAEKLYRILVHVFSSIQIRVAHSRDSERYEKIMEMREATCDWLITTTILERGVTFRDIDVVVIGSNHSVFNTASLVQIAGRVGRDARYPEGNVWFLYDQQTIAMKRARDQIKKMNYKESI